MNALLKKVIAAAAKAGDQANEPLGLDGFIGAVESALTPAEFRDLRALTLFDVLSQINVGDIVEFSLSR